MLLLSTSGAWGYGWWWLGGVFMVVCMTMMMLMMGHGSHGSRWFGWCGLGTPHEHSRRPEQTLADRLARGEIDLDEYERRRAALRDASAPARPKRRVSAPDQRTVKGGTS